MSIIVFGCNVSSILKFLLKKIANFSEKSSLKYLSFGVFSPKELNILFLIISISPYLKVRKLKYLKRFLPVDLLSDFSIKKSLK